MMIRLSNDVETNPGPPRIRISYPCTECTKNVGNNSVQCTICLDWTHLRCTTIVDINHYAKYLRNHTCSKCQAGAQAAIPQARKAAAPTLTTTPTARPTPGAKRRLRPAPPPPSQHTTKCRAKPATTRILSWNVNGWSKRRSELATIIAKEKPDIVCLQETKLDKTNLGYTPTGYKVALASRNKFGGGVCTMVRDDWIFTISKTTSKKTAEILSITIDKLIVTNVYFPPRSSDSPTAEVREDVMEILDMASEKHIITGDWNAHAKTWHSHKTDERGAMIEDELDTRGVHVVLNEDSFTRAASGVLSSPDITISTSDLAACSSWRTCGVLNTDHLPVIIDTMAEIPKLVRPNRIMANFKKANWTDFSDSIETKVACYAGPRDAYSLENFLSATITRAASKHIPHGKFTPTREHTGDTREIAELTRERERIQKRNPLDSNLKALNDKIEAARRELRRLCGHQKIEDMEDKRKIDCNALWRVIKGLKPKTKSTGSIKLPNGTTTTNPKTIANAMASSLVAVGKDRDCREERIAWRRTKRRLKKLRPQLPASSISHAEVKLAILKGKPSKALGPDGICHLHLKHVPDNCINLMAELFNASIDENKVPDSWKKANVFMLPKPGKDPSEIKSFRPVSLLSPVAKVLERIILERIRREIESPKDQHAFKKNHSTTTAITEATSCIVGGLNMEKPACRTIMTCLDMKAAFDTISIAKLLCGLEGAIADKKVCGWLGNYLHKRRINVQYDDVKSNWLTLRGGVPQGAVLSPNLFNFFIRDVPAIPDTKIITYADDMTLLVQDPLLSKAAEKSQDALDSLQKWFKDKHLDISAGKSTVTIFTADTKEFKYDPGLKWEGTVIPMQNRTRLLGVELDTMLRMTGHVEQVSARLAKANNILRALAGAKWGSSKETMLRTFKAIIKPLATYAGPAWHQLMSETQKTKLERQYVGGLKACCGLTKDTPKQLVYHETRMLPLSEELTLGSEQLAIAAIKTPGHPISDLSRRRPKERTSGNRPRTPPLGCLEDREDEWRRMRGDTRAVQKRNHTSFVKSYLSNHGIHPILGRQPPALSEEESTLPRNTRVELARLRAERSLLLEKYKAKVENRPVVCCINCNDDVGDLKHFLKCYPVKPLPMSKLWKDPVAAATALGLAVTPFDPGGDADS
uniref:Reverse transcriptase domain-containing protein n=2 Tax=Caenorhabditis japonica TaxID=281687 RepID=A0A8R1EPV5_CAEJA